MINQSNVVSFEYLNVDVVKKKKRKRKRKRNGLHLLNTGLTLANRITAHLRNVNLYIKRYRACCLCPFSSVDNL